MNVMRKTIAVLLSVFVLFSSFSYCLSIHYCGQNIVDIALFGNAKTCSMESEVDLDLKKSCCADRNIFIESEDYLSSKEFEKQAIKKVEILLVKLNFPIGILSEEQSIGYVKKHYTPPLIEHDITLVVQSFLL